MKKLLSILTIATLLCSCAAEKRLARFLQRHPELQRIDTVYFRDTILLPADSNALILSLPDLVAMDSAASTVHSEDTDTTAHHPTTAVVSTDRSKAALQALGNGQFALSSVAPPDTVYLEKKVEVPHLVTEYKDREVPVYKQKWWQAGFMFIGVLTVVITLLILCIWIGMKYIKPL